MVPLTQACEARVRLLFPAEEEQDEVKRLLVTECGDNLPLYKVPDHLPAGYDRIRFAVLKLAHGDIVRFRKEIETNKRDWRDTLVAAGFAQDIFLHQKWLSDQIAPD